MALLTVCQNVVYCLKHLSPFKRLSGKAQAKKLKVNASTITRWLNGTEPRPNNLSRIAELVGISSKTFELSHQEFLLHIKELHSIMEHEDIKPFIQLGSIEKYKHLWSDCAHRLKGTYILHTRVLTDPNVVAKSLLRVFDKGERGIPFDIHNADNRYQPARVYKYDGLLFPILDTVMFFAEEASHDEPFVMITNLPQLIPPPYLVGYMLAVGVNDEIRKPAGSKSVAAFRSDTLIEPNSILNELGLVGRDKIKPKISELLFS